MNANAVAVLSPEETAAVSGAGPSDQPVARYHLENAWPAKIEIGSLKAGASEILMES